MSRGNNKIKEYGKNTQFGMSRGNHLKGKRVKFGSGQDPRRGGRPKGKSNRTKLKQLIKDLSEINKTNITPKEKALIYQIYELAIADYTVNDADASVKHLYFIESDFGIKIGVSKDIANRIRQIKSYASSARVLKVINNGGKFENNLHNKFKKLNIKGNPTIGTEWFLKNDDLISFINETDNIEDLVSEFGSEISKQLCFNFY